MPLPPSPTFHPVANPNAVVCLENARFTVLTDRLFRLEYSKDNHFEDRPSQAFWFREQPVPDFKKTIRDSGIEIETDFLHLKYQPSSGGFNTRTLTITMKRTGVTWKYGISQSGNLKGTARTLDFDIGRTRLENGLLSKSGWVVVDDSNSLVFNDSGWLEPRTPVMQPKSLLEKYKNILSPSRTYKDLYFFGYDRDYTACLGDFRRVAGPIPMIPRYILGNWWSRYHAYTQAELQSLMEDFRAHEIPLSVCIIDMDWHITQTGNESNGWTGYTWNRKLFPDPNGFIDWLHNQGLRTALNLHPAKGVYPHEEQYEQMALWMGIDPATKQPIPFDIANPRFMEGYFEILHHPQESPKPVSEKETNGKDGVDFWWLDWQQGKRAMYMDLTHCGCSITSTFKISGAMDTNAHLSSRAGVDLATIATRSALAATRSYAGVHWPSNPFSPQPQQTLPTVGGVTTSVGTCSGKATLNSTCAGCNSVSLVLSFDYTPAISLPSSAVHGRNPSVYSRQLAAPCSSGTPSFLTYIVWPGMLTRPASAWSLPCIMGIWKMTRLIKRRINTSLARNCWPRLLRNPSTQRLAWRIKKFGSHLGTGLIFLQVRKYMADNGTRSKRPSRTYPFMQKQARSYHWLPNPNGEESPTRLISSFTSSPGQIIDLRYMRMMAKPPTISVVIML